MCSYSCCGRGCCREKTELDYNHSELIVVGIRSFLVQMSTNARNQTTSATQMPPAPTPSDGTNAPATPAIRDLASQASAMVGYFISNTFRTQLSVFFFRELRF